MVHSTSVMLLLMLLLIIPFYAYAEVEISQPTQQKESWRTGELLIASATIFAFFGFGSFLGMRLQNREYRSFLIRLFAVILILIFLIELGQVYVIVSIVTDKFDPISYEPIMYVTLLMFGLILLFALGIISVESRAEEAVPVATDAEVEFVQNIESRTPI